MLPEPDLASLTAIAVYLIVWGFVFAECGLLVGFLLPGDTLLFAAGLVAAAPASAVNLPLLIVGIFVAAVSGNELAYRTGHRYGRGWVEKREHGRARSGLARAEMFYMQFGWWAVFAARWTPWVRTFVPVIAGTAAMNRRSFTSANVAGALVWAIGLPTIGFLSYEITWLRVLAGVIAATSIIAALLGGTYTFIRARIRSQRASAADTPDDQGTEGSPPPDASQPTSGS